MAPAFDNFDFAATARAPARCPNLIRIDTAEGRRCTQYRQELHARKVRKAAPTACLFSGLDGSRLGGCDAAGGRQAPDLLRNVAASGRVSRISSMPGPTHQYDAAPQHQRLPTAIRDRGCLQRSAVRFNMLPMTKRTLPSLAPDLRLFGAVDQHMLAEFFRQQTEIKAQKPVVLELSTSGGDADIGRRIAEELRLMQQEDGREVFFFGKTYVFSAGITIMSSIPRSHRFMTRDCELLIHERKMKKELHLVGALRGCRSAVQDVLAEIDSGQRLEREGFAQLVRGSRLTVEDVEKKVLNKDWYVTAEEAVEIGLIAGIV